ncbi:MAG: hypothetical protein ACI80V_001897 [Rhodothermales bacterium]|jgi:hypothetical protein
MHKELEAADLRHGEFALEEVLEASGNPTVPVGRWINHLTEAIWQEAEDPFGQEKHSGLELQRLLSPLQAAGQNNH